MFAAPANDAVAPARPIHLVRARRRAFDEPSSHAVDADDRAKLRRYLSDLTRPHGLALREDLITDGTGQAYGAMGEAIIDATVPVDEPVDLLVMAMAVPDVHPGRATATYLSHVCPGRPLAFTICDQGVAAAFTALRLAHDYTVHGRSQRSLVLVVEQSTLHYEPAAPVTLPRRDTAVGLLLQAGTPGGTQGPVVRQHTDVAPGEVAAVLHAELDHLPCGTVILGETLRTHMGHGGAGATALRTVPAGQPSTGVWWALVDELAQPQAEHVVVAEYEPALRYLCLATFPT